MSMSYPKLPAEWAISLCKSCELIHHLQVGFDWITNQVIIEQISNIAKSERTQEHKDILEEWTERYHRLQAFQKMAVITGYDTAIKIYTGIKLTDEQTETLKLIADITPHWAKGEVVDYLMRAISDNQTDRKTLAALAEAMMNAVDGETPNPSGKGKDANKSRGVVKQFYMELTGEQVG